MASTRFKYDECRTKKELQQSTDPGRWILNVPGNGSTPFYMEDPYIRIQKCGGNYRKDKSFILFDIKVGEIYLSRENVEEIAKSMNIDVVPIAWKG